MEKNMTIKEIAEKLYTLDFEYENGFCRLQEEFSVKGEDCVLMWLYRIGTPLYSGDLAKKLSLTSGRIANILRTLEQKKFVTRSTDLNDGRKVLVTLTTAGKKHIEKINKRNVAKRAEILEALGEGDAAEYLRITQRILQVLNS